MTSAFRWRRCTIMKPLYQYSESWTSSIEEQENPPGCVVSFKRQSSKCLNKHLEGSSYGSIIVPSHPKAELKQKCTVLKTIELRSGGRENSPEYQFQEEVVAPHFAWHIFFFFWRCRKYYKVEIRSIFIYGRMSNNLGCCREATTATPQTC